MVNTRYSSTGDTPSILIRHGTVLFCRTDCFVLSLYNVVRREGHIIMSLRQTTALVLPSDPGSPLQQLPVVLY